MFLHPSRLTCICVSRDLSNEQKPWLFRVYRGLYYPVMGIVINQYKDPYEPISIVECQQGFQRCSLEKLAEPNNPHMLQAAIPTSWNIRYYTSNAKTTIPENRKKSSHPQGFDWSLIRPNENHPKELSQDSRNHPIPSHSPGTPKANLSLKMDGWKWWFPTISYVKIWWKSSNW